MKAVLKRIPPLALWGGLCLLLAMGVLSSIFDLATVPVTETHRANQTQQRLIIDPVTGRVGSAAPAATTASFDVAAPEAGETPPTKDAADEAPATETEKQTPEVAPPAPTADPKFERLRRDAGNETIPQVAFSQQSLVSAPAPEITETASGVAVPMRGEKNASAASLYARPFVRRAQQPLLAIVVTDAGFSDATLQQIMDLPGEVSVALSPYASESAKQIRALRNKGHEVWGMLPAATSRFPQADPGPLGLIPSINAHESIDRLRRAMGATLGSVGFVLPMDEALSTQKERWPPVLKEIDDRGLLVLSTHPTRTLDQLTRDPKLQEHLRRADMVLDSTPGVAFIRSKLAGVKDAVMAQKKLVVLVSARPLALKTLADWLATEPLGDAAVLAPLSAIYAPDAPPPAPAKKESGHGGSEEESGHGEAKEEKAEGGHGGGH